MSLEQSGTQEEAGRQQQLTPTSVAGSEVHRRHRRNPRKAAQGAEKAIPEVSLQSARSLQFAQIA